MNRLIQFDVVQTYSIDMHNSLLTICPEQGVNLYVSIVRYDNQKNFSYQVPEPNIFEHSFRGSIRNTQVASNFK